ncbi:MAG: hypothetical protein PHZ26_02615 [Candidatus Gracilibacteria bacterium]|nr:hypothetical protein [Candidatus Gracilibacteria bacterium]MDD2908625.1 hypothetical protein [Candidatus Gracilibacteria bacterium]
MKLELYRNKKGSALMIAIICIVIISSIMIYFLEKLLPIARNIKGIENSTVAYYNGLSGIEQSLLFMKTASVGTESGVTYNTSNPQGYSFQITASGTKIPIAGEGNSEYNSGRNIIGPGQPIQLAIGSGITWSSVELKFKAPDGMGLTGTLDNSGIINWQLSGKNTDGTGIILYASGESNMIKGGMIDGNPIYLDTKDGFDLNGSGGTFDDFYDTDGSPFNATTGLGANGANCTSNSCTLKLSIINPLIGTGGQAIPYLEYKIDFGFVKVPLQYAIIQSDGYSYGFKRHIRSTARQQTTSEALDFTIFQ